MLRNIFTNSFIVSSLTVLQFLVLLGSQVILARLIEPEVFGIFAVITVISMFFYTVSNMNTDRYLIKEQEKIEEIMDTTFTMEVIWTIFIFLSGLILLPSIIYILDKPDVLIYCQVYLLACFSNPCLKLKSLMEKKSKFLYSSFPIVISSIISSLVAIYMVYNGETLWALVAWRCLSYILEGVIIFSISDYKPKLKLNFEIVKKTHNFVYPLTLSAIISFVYTNIDYLIIDKVMDAKTVGFYWLAYQTSHYFLAVRSSINKVVYPALSRMGSQNSRKGLFTHVNFITALIYITPLVFTVFLGEEVITLVYGKEWGGAVILFKIFMVVVLFKAVASSAGPLLHVHGNTRNDLEVALINMLLLPVSIYLMVLYFGVVGAAIGVGIVTIISSYYVYQRYIKPITGKGYFDYFDRLIVIVVGIFVVEYFFDTNSLYANFGYIVGSILLTGYLYINEIKSVMLDYGKK